MRTIPAHKCTASVPCTFYQPFVLASLSCSLSYAILLRCKTRYFSSWPNGCNATSNGGSTCVRTDMGVFTTYNTALDDIMWPILLNRSCKASDAAGKWFSIACFSICRRDMAKMADASHVRLQHYEADKVPSLSSLRFTPGKKNVGFLTFAAMSAFWRGCAAATCTCRRFNIDPIDLVTPLLSSARHLCVDSCSWNLQSRVCHRRMTARHQWQKCGSVLSDKNCLAAE